MYSINATGDDHHTLVVVSLSLTTFGTHFEGLKGCKQSSNNDLHKLKLEL